MFVGGIIPDEDISQLKGWALPGVYGPGASTQDHRRGHPETH